MPFGGYSDGVPSTVADDLLPFISAELDILINAFPAIEQLITDLEIFIPDDTDMLTLLTWFFNLDSGLYPILEDLNNLLPYIIEALVLLQNDGFPILYDLIEEAQANIPPGTLYVSDLDFFKDLVASVEAQYGPDATIGDVGLLQILFPIILDMLLPGLIPPDLDPMTLPLAYLLGAVGSLDVAGVLPLLDDILGMLETAMPDLITSLENMDFTTIELPF